MVPVCVQNAIRTLESKTDSQLDREVLTAYSVLYAFAHYYPSSVVPELRDCLQRFSFVREREPSRLLKQRRIAMSRILRELAEANDGTRPTCGDSSSKR